LGESAGGRKIFLFKYGEKQVFNRKANYNSACGANDPSFYADKGSDAKPVILLVGAVHGGEMEGTVALMNLIKMLETGTDYREKSYEFKNSYLNNCRLLIIPCMNPDGRGRLGFDSFVGMSDEEMHYYMQGTWKDGSHCGWPGCKSVHPIKDEVKYLGAYYNDDGINLMHDNFFRPMAKETQYLMNLADVEAPDFTVLLHGGGNGTNQIMPLRYAPIFIKEKLTQFDKDLGQRHTEAGIDYKSYNKVTEDGKDYPAPTFNLTSALHHVCGGISFSYESNMALGDGRNMSYPPETILESHYLLFSEIYDFIIKQENSNVEVV
jgi:hypothetical protein